MMTSGVLNVVQHVASMIETADCRLAVLVEQRQIVTDVVTVQIIALRSDREFKLWRNSP